MREQGLKTVRGRGNAPQPTGQHLYESAERADSTGNPPAKWSAFAPPLLAGRAGLSPRAAQWRPALARGRT
eukprot:4732015-Lingulodinium_polyedra.AAC.1